MKKIVVVCATLSAAMLFAQTPKTETQKPNDAPKIPEALISQFYKAVAQEEAAQLKLHETQEWRYLEFYQMQTKQIISHMSAACGSNFKVQVDSQQDVACVPNATPQAPSPTQTKK